MLRKIDALVKRLFDIAAASLGLVAVSPVLVLIALGIKLDSKGPVIYRGKRIGQWGKRIWVLKFRTMVVDSDKIGGPSTADDDPRMTRLGRHLRRYKLDELPQLLNVLKGDMSLVGPRPEVDYYVRMFTEEERAVLSVRPGITDLATLWNADEGAVLAGSPDPEKAYMEKIRPEKIRLQLEYVRTRTFWLDLSIIVRTLASIVSRSDPEAARALEDSKRPTKSDGQK